MFDNPQTAYTRELVDCRPAYRGNRARCIRQCDARLKIRAFSGSEVDTCVVPKTLSELMT